MLTGGLQDLVLDGLRSIDLERGSRGSLPGLRPNCRELDLVGTGVQTSASPVSETPFIKCSGNLDMGS